LKRLPGPVDVGPVVDSQDADDTSLLIDLVDHVVWASTGGPEPSQLTL
jgi:hypothetical protein